MADIKYVEVPLLVGHDQGRIVGTVKIEESVAWELMGHRVIAAGFSKRSVGDRTVSELIELSVVDACPHFAEPSVVEET